MCPPQDPQSLQGVAPHTQVSPGTDILPLSHLSGPLMASPYRWVRGDKIQPVSRPRDTRATRVPAGSFPPHQDSGQPWLWKG